MKLFKKLNEQIEVNNCKNVAINETEKKDIENKILFENFIEKLKDEIEITQ